MEYKFLRSKGFTLIELIITIGIIGILVGIASPMLRGQLEKAKISRISGDIKSVELFVEERVIDSGKLPENWNDTGVFHSKKIYSKSGIVNDTRVIKEGPYKDVNLEDSSGYVSFRSTLRGKFVTNNRGNVYYISDEEPSAKNGNAVANYSDFMVYYYNLTNKNIENLKRYNMVVVEPRATKQSPELLEELMNSETDLYGYISVMEVDNVKIKDNMSDKDFITIDGKRPTHGYFKHEFGDIRSEGYRNALIEVIQRDIINKGYDGVFFDTLDDVNLSVFRNNKNPETNEKIRDELIDSYVDFFKVIKERFPGLSIIQNRGFEIYQAGGANYVDAILFENFKSEDFENNSLDWLYNGLQDSSDNSNSVILAMSYRYEKKQYSDDGSYIYVEHDKNSELTKENYELAKDYNWIFTYYDKNNAENKKLEDKEHIYKNEYIK